MRHIAYSWWIAVAQLQARVSCELDRVRGALGGQSTVEYALVGALVVIAAAGALSILGGELATVFTNMTNKLAGGR